jgi:eukaryotic-like serine/threonine-protein kinase
MASAVSGPLRELLERPEAERIIGAFHLKQQLGQGGFAPVWLADEVADRTTLRQAAVKLFAIDPRLGEQARHDIIAEAGRLCRVEHPNIVRFYSLPVDEARGVVGLAMEYVGGRSLADRLRAEGRLPAREAVDVGIAVASALVAVQAADIVHRDIWPANVIENPGLRGSPAAYKLIDFGIASPDPESRRFTPEAAGPSVDIAALGKRGYVDPVCWRGRSPPTLRSDLYALGATLFVCLSGRIPAAARGRLDEDILSGASAPPRLDDLSPDVPVALADLVAELLDPEPSRRPRSAELVAIALEQIRAGFSGRKRSLPSEKSGPFRGLGRFERGDRDVFFGRRAEVASALEVLRTRGLLALVGPSGSGKSSLARAGILPAVEDGALGGPRVWDTVIVSPGPDPRRIITTVLFHMGIDPQSGPEEAAARIEAWLAENRRGLVLLVDQLEELATLEQADDGLRESRAFARDLLARLGERARPALRVIVAARNDMLAPILAHHRLGRVFMRGTALVSSFDGAAWGPVIDAALESYGYALEDRELREALMASLARSAGAMPLVEFALAELWRGRDPARKLITWACWKRLGGIAGALDQHAEATLFPRGQAVVDQAKLKGVLVALTTPSGARIARLPSELTGGDPDAERAVHLLEDARLLVREDDRVTLSHEALLSHWRRLKLWIDEEREGRLMLEDFERVAGLWVDKQDDELLYQRRRLLVIQEIVRRQGKALHGPAQAFFRASRAAVWWGYVKTAALALLGVIVVAVGWYGYEAERRAEERAARERERAAQAVLEMEREKAEASATKAHLLAQVDELSAHLHDVGDGGPTRDAPAAPARVVLDPAVRSKIEAYVAEQNLEHAPVPAGVTVLLEDTAPADTAPASSAGSAPAPPTSAEPAPSAGAEPQKPAFAPFYMPLDQAKARASTGCGDRAGPRGTGHVVLFLEPDGKASRVSVDAPFAGSDVGSCVEATFGAVKVSPFSGAAIKVIWSFTVR